MFILRKFLRDEINRNINWNEVLSKYYAYIDDIKEYGKNEKVTTEINKLLNTIKSNGWVDKPPGEEVNYNDDINKYIRKITIRLMNNNYDNNKVFGILYCNNNKNLPEYFFNKYTEQLKILTFILNMNEYKYNIVDNVEDLNKNNYIIPLTSFLLSSQEEVDKINHDKILFPTFHDYNIVFPENIENYENIYTLIHLIINYLEHEDTNIYNYNYLKVIRGQKEF